MPATSRTAFINERRSLEQQPKCTRPPNAFMLYRLNFVKRQVVPPEVEKRQQNLSRIAGQCWSVLPETEKAIWYEKAAIIRAEHYKTVPSRKDANRLSSKTKRRGSTINPGPSFGRYQSPRTQPPPFAPLHDPRFPSLASPQASHISTTAASESPWSMAASPSPLSSSHPFPSFPSHNSTSQGSPFVASTNSSRNEFCDLLELLGSEVPQSGSHVRGPANGPNVGSFQEPYAAPQQHEQSLATCVPYPGLEQPRMLHSYPALSGTNPFPLYFTEANGFGLTDNICPFNPLLT